MKRGGATLAAIGGTVLTSLALSFAPASATEAPPVPESPASSNPAAAGAAPSVSTDALNDILPASEPAEEPEDSGSAGAANEAPSQPAFSMTGYIDVGYAKAEGDGSSFQPGDMREPADYFVDTFAPAVNSRGEVASTDSGGRAVTGFLPRSVGIGGKGSFLINTVNVDLRYQPTTTPVLAFTRVQFLPRFAPTGETTQVVVDQAFGRVSPFDNAELAISLGKFDSVFGIEYLENQSNFRVGITPSLMARYTTGTSVGGKVFYRRQLSRLSSAFSINVAATNSGNMVESLQGPDRSLTGAPVVSARAGYELDLSRAFLKLGVSGLIGPRNDQPQTGAQQMMLGGDLRFFFAGFMVNAEYISVHEDEVANAGTKLTGLGPFPPSAEFYAHAFYVFAGQEIPLPFSSLRAVTIYGRYEHRHATFEDFSVLTVERYTFGGRLHLWDSILLKGEVLINRELDGTPTVANNVVTSSAVWTW